MFLVVAVLLVDALLPLTSAGMAESVSCFPSSRVVDIFDTHGTGREEERLAATVLPPFKPTFLLPILPPVEGHAVATAWGKGCGEGDVRGNMVDSIGGGRVGLHRGVRVSRVHWMPPGLVPCTL